MDLGPPRVVHCLHAPHHLYIGRNSQWGNPFRIGRDANRSHVLAKYEQYLLQCPRLLADLPKLEGLVLGCWCAPKPCHGDVLLRMANSRLPVETAM
ncbi:MAG: DUF4326 domain-containing protein [Solirubrobacteraceae bacterium]